MAVNNIYADISKERVRQELLKAQGKFAHTAADPEVPNTDTLAVLVEEVGEVARALNDDAEGTNFSHLREELVQVAAVAVAWIEKLDFMQENPKESLRRIVAAVRESLEEVSQEAVHAKKS